MITNFRRLPETSCIGDLNKGLIFLCLSCGLLVLTIITICVAPIITGNLGSGWGQLNCQYFADAHKNTKDDSSKTKDQKDKELKTIDKLFQLSLVSI